MKHLHCIKQWYIHTHLLTVSLYLHEYFATQLQAQSKIKVRKLAIKNYFSVTYQFTLVIYKFKFQEWDTQCTDKLKILWEKLR